MKILLSSTFRSCRFVPRCLRSALSLIVINGALYITAQSQTFPPGVGPVGDSMQHPLHGTGHDYINLLSETVNPANGSLNIEIRLPSPAGRGINPPIALRYNSGELNSLIQTPAGVVWATSVNNPNGEATGWGTPDSFPLEGTASMWNVTSPAGTYGTESPSFNCNFVSGFHFTDLNGVAHTIGNGAAASPSSNPTESSECQYDNAVANVPYADSDSQLWGVLPTTTSSNNSNESVTEYDLQNGLQVPISLIDIEGNTYNFTSPSMGEFNWSTFVGMEDRNGNQLNGQDTAGRPMTLQYGVPVLPSGQTQSTFTVANVQYTITVKTITVNYSPAGGTDPILVGAPVTCPVGTPPVNQATLTVIASLGLPNGQQYTFQYDPVYGVIDEIDYPDGGKVVYNWALSNGDATFSSFTGIVQGEGPEANACAALYQVPQIASRQVYFGGSTSAAQSQQFTYATTWNYSAWTGKSTKVVTTDVVRNQAYTTTYTYVPSILPVAVAFGTACAGSCPSAMEQTITYQDWSGSVLDEVWKAWYNPFQIACEVHEPNTNQQLFYGHFYQYNYGFVSDDKEYDYGQVNNLSTYCAPNAYAAPTTTPARETKTSFFLFASPTNTGLTFAKPCSVSILGNTGAEIAETDYNYDENNSITAIASAAGLTNHDDTNFSSSFQGTPQQFSTTSCPYVPSANPVVVGRGNVTTMRRKCIGGTGCTGDSVSTFTYDETGQLSSATDACGNNTCGDMSPSGASAANHQITYSYVDNYPAGGALGGLNTNAYLTQVTYPSPNGTLMQHIYSYRYNDGLLSIATDENQQMTEYYYNDLLDRLTEIDYPDKGKTNYGYNDGTYSPSSQIPNVTTSTLLSGSTLKTTIAQSDGLGHLVQTILKDPVDGDDLTQTVYDGEGRVEIRYNPYRASPGAYTTFYYDASGRSVAQQQPDGTWLNWCYSDAASTLPSGDTVSGLCASHLGSLGQGSWVDAVDETGRHWQRSSDSFGRLLTVMEPDTSNNPTIETDYGYDALNDLLSVNQLGGAGSGTVTRTFAYDSLGQLVAANNPETASVQMGFAPNQTCAASGRWTACYYYDVNGNLASKIDNRGVQTSYTYDWLNRVTSKNYSDGATPRSCYQYDLSSVSGSGSNLNGRLTNSWTQPYITACSNPPGNSYLTLRALLSYDAMGRIQTDEQCTPSGCRSATPCGGYSYSYDLAGNVTCYTNGLPAVQGSSNPSFSINQSYIYSGQATSTGRLATVTSSYTPDSAHPSTLFSAQPGSSSLTNSACQSGSYPAYAPFGGLMNAAFPNSSGNGLGLSLSRNYDNRLRPACEWDIGTVPTN
jgi:YD repeat-containing protein